MCIVVYGLEFHKTCDAFPEQYDVMNRDGELVGYVRLRHGVIECKYPDVDGEYIYYKGVEDAFAGFFEDDDERMYHLKAIAEEIYKHRELSEAQKVLKPCPFCGGEAEFCKGKTELRDNAGYYVNCKECFANTGESISSDYHRAIEEAVRDWNKRTPDIEKVTSEVFLMGNRVWIGGQGYFVKEDSNEQRA